MSLRMSLLALVFMVPGWTQEPKPITYEAPKGWTAVAAGSFALAKFEVGTKDSKAVVSISGLNGDGGGLAPNLNRWRTQIGLEALGEDAVVKATQAIKVDGNAGHLFDQTGPDAAGKPAQRTLGVVVKQGGQSWYIKLMGPASVVKEQKDAFDAFVKSVRFAK